MWNWLIQLAFFNNDGNWPLNSVVLLLLHWEWVHSLFILVKISTSLTSFSFWHQWATALAWMSWLKASLTNCQGPRTGFGDGESSWWRPAACCSLSWLRQPSSLLGTSLATPVSQKWNMIITHTAAVWLLWSRHKGIINETFSVRMEMCQIKHMELLRDREDEERHRVPYSALLK